MVPRILWPEKPVSAGSPAIVSEMTGLHLSPTTSFGVGNVMELQINFGIPGVVLGFFGLGWLLGMLDFKAAVAEFLWRFGKANSLFPRRCSFDPAERVLGRNVQWCGRRSGSSVWLELDMETLDGTRCLCLPGSWYGRRCITVRISLVAISFAG